MTLVVLGGLGGWGLWKATAPLATDRPTGRNASALRESMGKANARLWQDPLPAVQRSFEVELARVEAQPAEKQVDPEAPIDPDAKKPEQPTPLQTVQRETQRKLRDAIQDTLSDRGVVLMPFRTSSDPTPESQENRVNYRYAIVSALASENYIPRDRSHIGWFVGGEAESADEAFPIGFEWWDPIAKERPPVLLLWVPSDLLRERSQIADLRSVLTSLVSEDDLASEKVLVRYLTTGGSNALIGLVHEDIGANRLAGTNLPHLSPVVGEFMTMQPRIYWPQLRVYDGFATISDAELLARLPSIERQPWAIRSGPLRDTYAALKRAADRSSVPAGADDAAAASANPHVALLALQSGALVRRTIGPDEDLVTAIAKELKRRGIDPGQNGNRIALVHEWDTAYGRALPETFRRICLDGQPKVPALRADLRSAEALQDELEHDSSWIGAAIPSTGIRLLNRACVRQLRENLEGERSRIAAAIPSFTFLRGVDGRVSGEDAPSSQDTSRSASGPKDTGLMSVLDVRAAAERPLGQSQLDYLRRLVETLQSEDRESRREGKRIAAIGVLASDTYDKQPIIQALRAGFPDAQYFTLDLHALLTHPKSYETMRNLLIASHFDLRLGSALQGTTPPFRYSYQTSLYRTAKLAVREPQSRPGAETEVDTVLQQLTAPPMARVYEIGRSGHFDITADDPGAAEALYPPTHTDRAFGALGSGLLFTWPAWLMGLVAAAAAIFTICVWMPSGWWTRHERRWRLRLSEGAIRGGAAIGGTICLLLLVFAAPAPALLLGGGSIAMFGLHHWETSWRSRCGESLSCERHGWSSLFTPQHLAGMLTLIGLGGLITLFLWISTRPGQEPFVVLEGVSTWPSDIIRLVVCVLAVWFLYLARKNMHRAISCLAGELGLPDIGSSSTASALRTSGGSLASRVLDWFRHRTIVGFDIETDSTTEVDGALAWQRYLDRSRGRDALLRTAVLLVIAAIPVLCLFNLWGWPEVPSRGLLSRTISTTVLWGALVLTIAVCFHVWDATRLCRRFVQALAYRPSRWPTAVVARVERRIAPSLDDAAANAWIDIHVIATLTEAVGRAIWFPFTLLLLLVVAQHTVFDHWEINPAAVATFIVASGVAFLSALTLRSAAEEARREELTHLRQRLMALQGDAPPAPAAVHDEPAAAPSVPIATPGGQDLVEEIAGSEAAAITGRSAVPATAVRVEPFDRATAAGVQVDRRSLREMLKMLISEIERERRGAFSPFSQNPAMQAVLLPFSGLGLLQLIEQFATMN